ncbi:hypothetical protein PENTCL1PPCAC_18113, partial [Pristionchus entomophagus]
VHGTRHIKRGGGRGMTILVYVHWQDRQTQQHSLSGASGMEGTSISLATVTDLQHFRSQSRSRFSLLQQLLLLLDHQIEVGETLEGRSDQRSGRSSRDGAAGSSGGSGRSRGGLVTICSRFQRRK